MIKKSWLAGIEDEEKQKEIIEIYNEAILFRKKLSEILKKKAASNRKSSISKEGYNLSSWPYLQADGVGYERAIAEVISLLDTPDVSNVD
jgi:hypothetical protein